MKVGIVGSGQVGATAAYAMVLQGVGREIVLIDQNTVRAQAEADDIAHATPFSNPTHIYAGDYPDLAGSTVVIITAGVGQKPGETRLQLLERNAAIFRDIIPRIVAHAPNAVLLVATNPVDVMTHLAARYAASSGVPTKHVMGSGTVLDTARFQSLLGRYLGVDPHHIHGYVLGEHGDSEMIAWSTVRVGGLSLEEYGRRRQVMLDKAVRDEITHRVRDAAYTHHPGQGRDLLRHRGRAGRDRGRDPGQPALDHHGLHAHAGDRGRGRRDHFAAPSGGRDGHPGDLPPGPRRGGAGPAPP